MSRSPLPSKFPVESIVAIIDTREQTPLTLPNLKTERGTLATGDYSVRGLENVIAIERKSLPDLVSCCGRDRERFEREVQRLLAYPCRALVVEAQWCEIESASWRGRLTSKQVGSSLTSWVMRGLPVIMAGHRDRSGIIVASLLRQAAKHRYREARQFAVNILDSQGGPRVGTGETRNS